MSTLNAKLFSVTFFEQTIYLQMQHFCVKKTSYDIHNFNIFLNPTQRGPNNRTKLNSPIRQTIEP
jgi:hypothetical protein